MSEPLFLGVDVGTQSLRAALFTRTGQELAIASSPLDIHFPRPTWAEQDPQAWWNALIEVVPVCLAKAGVGASQVAALAVDATASTVVACDADGKPLRPALLWMDTRSHDQAQRLSASGSPVLRYAGRTVSPEFGLPKALWLRQNEPEVYARAAIICECLEWLNFHLTGRWVASRNTATCKWSYIPSQGGWPIDLLDRVDAADLRDRLPGQGDDPLYPGYVIGPLTRAAATALGLQPGIPVAQGAIDAYAAAIGMNALKPGRLGLILGTSNCHMAVSDQGVFGTGSWGPYPEPLTPNLWILEGGQTATGSIVRWVERSMGGGRSIDVLDAEAEGVGPGAGGLLALEDWQGNRSPRMDPLARGVFVGLTLSHGVGHILRAVYEAIAYGTRHIIEDMVANNFDAREVIVTGGGTRSRLWLQLNADICSLPMVLTTQPEATVLGAAMCAAVGAGIFPDLQSAGACMVQERERIEPNAAIQETYSELYRYYLEAYDALQPLMHTLSSRP